MRFIIVFLLSFTCLVSVRSQTDVSILNHYKYVYLTSGNMPPFVKFSLYDDVAEKFKACGLNVIKKKDKQQITDTCSIVYCDLQPVACGPTHTSSNNCVQLYFRDCNNQPVFISKKGSSGVLFYNTKWGYENATAEALQSFSDYHYSYVK